MKYLFKVVQGQNGDLRTKHNKKCIKRYVGYTVSPKTVQNYF